MHKCNSKPVKHHLENHMAHPLPHNSVHNSANLKSAHQYAHQVLDPNAEIKSKLKVHSFKDSNGN